MVCECSWLKEPFSHSQAKLMQSTVPDTSRRNTLGVCVNSKSIRGIVIDCIVNSDQIIVTLNKILFAVSVMLLVHWMQLPVFVSWSCSLHVWPVANYVRWRVPKCLRRLNFKLESCLEMTLLNCDSWLWHSCSETGVCSQCWQYAWVPSLYCSAYGSLTVRSLLDTREHCLEEFHFVDPYSQVQYNSWLFACLS